MTMHIWIKGLRLTAGGGRAPSGSAAGWMA